MPDRRTEALHPAAQGLHAAPAAQVLGRLLAAQVAAAAAVTPALGAVEAAADLAFRALSQGGARGATRDRPGGGRPACLRIGTGRGYGVPGLTREDFPASGREPQRGST